MPILAVRIIVQLLFIILQLDYAKSYSNAHFGQGNGTIAIGDVACVGTETSLLSCSSSAIFGTSCTHSQDAGVGCEGTIEQNKNVNQSLLL